MRADLQKALDDGHFPDGLLDNLTDKQRLNIALDFAIRWGGFDGSHHKAWAIDHIIRILSGKKYEKIVKENCQGEDGPNTYEWDVGIPP